QDTPLLSDHFVSVAISSTPPIILRRFKEFMSSEVELMVRLGRLAGSPVTLGRGPQGDFTNIAWRLVHLASGYSESFCTNIRQACGIWIKNTSQFNNVCSKFPGSP